MNKYLILLSISLLSFTLPSCSSTTPKQNKALSTLAGGVAGGTIAGATSQGTGTTMMIGTGVIIGALIGSVFGNFMENSDKEKAYTALNSGKAASWQNPKTKTSYSVIPTPNYVCIQGNPYCRRIVATQTTVEGNTRKIYRSACRQSDGGWDFV